MPCNILFVLRSKYLFAGVRHRYDKGCKSCESERIAESQKQKSKTKKEDCGNP